MKKTVVAITAIIILLAICIVQHIKLRQAMKPKPNPIPVAAEITRDTEQLAAVLPMPEGATELKPGSGKLTGTGGTLGIHGCLWIDISGAYLDRRNPETRIAEVARFYAQNVAKAIPDAYATKAIGVPGFVGAGSLHSTWMVEHPAGHVAVSVGYMYARNAPSTITDQVQVHIICSNRVKHARQWIEPLQRRAR